MAYDRNRQSDSCGVVAAAMLALIVIFFVVAAGTLFYMRARNTQRALVVAEEQAARAHAVAQEQALRARAVAEQARAEAEAAQAEAAAQREQALAEADPEPSATIDVAKIVVRMDETGNVSIEARQSRWTISPLSCGSGSMRRATSSPWSFKFLANVHSNTWPGPEHCAMKPVRGGSDSNFTATTEPGKPDVVVSIEVFR